MRINSNRSQPIPLPSTDATAQGAPATAAAEAAAERGVMQAGGYAPSAELTLLTSLAQELPEVRPEVVRAAAARVAQDYYTTPASAERTAQAMLNAAD